MSDIPTLAVAQSPGSYPPIQMLVTGASLRGANHSALANTNTAVPRPLHASQVFNDPCGTSCCHPFLALRSTAASIRHVRNRDQVTVWLC